MTALAEKQRLVGPSGFVDGQLPQVNLLPPEVTAARGLRRVKRWLALAQVFVLAICAASYGLALMIQDNADSELLESQNTTVALQSEAATFAEVPRMQGQVARAEAAHERALADEVVWGEYVAAIAVTIPGDVSLEGVAVAGRTPMSEIASSTDPLVDTGVGRITMIARTPVIPDAAAWVDALNSLPGLANARVSTSEISESGGAVFYRTNVTVEVTEDALVGASADEQVGS